MVGDLRELRLREFQFRDDGKRCCCGLHGSCDGAIYDCGDDNRDFSE